MLDRFKRMIDLNKAYTKDLSKWAENSENLNDDALLKMLNNLVLEYEAEASILIKKLKFDKEMYKKRRRFEEKEKRTELAHEISKTKYEIKRKKRLNRKLYRLYKKKLTKEFNKLYLEQENEFNEFCKNFYNSKSAEENAAAKSEKVEPQENIKEKENIEKVSANEEFKENEK